MFNSAAHLECELAAVVVHAAAVHQTEHVPDHVAGQDPGAGGGAHPAIGQTRPQQGQSLTRDLHAAGLRDVGFKKVNSGYIYFIWRS